MLGRTFAGWRGASADTLVDPAVLDLLEGDVVTANLECLLTSAEEANPYSKAAFRADPEFAAPLLRRFHVVNLANNHVYDYLDKGIADTRDALARLGVEMVGVGETEEEALQPSVVTSHGRKVALFGMATVVNLVPGRSEFVVARPGLAAYERISEAAAENDFVVVHLHAGGGDLPYPAPEVRRLHDRLRRAGANIVLGHHPHCIQGWVETDRSANFFSLGDFVFDRLEEGRDQALVVRMAVAERLDVVVVPVVRTEDFIIRIAEGEQEQRLADHLLLINAALASGESDRLYVKAYGARAGRLLLSLRTQLRIGGPGAVIARLRRVGLRRAVTILRALLARQGRASRRRECGSRAGTLANEP